MEDKLNKLKKEFEKALTGVADFDALEEVRVEFLGRKGKMAEMMKGLKDLHDEERKHMGQVANKVKGELEKFFDLKTEEIEAKSAGEIEKDEWIDITLPGVAPREGHLHPTTQAIAEIEDIFSRIGFTRFPIPDIDWDYYTFESLNMPPDHPARDNWETFFIDAPEGKKGKLVATPHTSNGQVRIMEAVKPPFRKLYIGKCYRRQNDISHLPIHHQFEILMVDKGLSVKNLKGVIEYFVHTYFGKDRKVRLRPHHFRFTEPSFEVDISCDICKGSGKLGSSACRLCKSGWLELAGAGMTHPNVLKAGGIDPEKYSAIAFAFGIERTYMMRAGIAIPDIRLIYRNDLRFVQQF
ncbi:MAG: phenylalanine--tRNA ligase subunit alpha [Candidatus Uhrbacteria bacterium]|nr:phenylalanine--tRNA ligase subunit alpha [Patescibacteria group bacterium]MBU1907080.1 phenylalanine--tRNA ligase subunit alpha [Patescibacteria group bacterium]